MLTHGMALAADPVGYTVRINPTGDSAMDRLLAASSQLEALRTKAPAGPFALVARARADVPVLRMVLESAGYYQPRIAVTIDGHGLDDTTLPDLLGALPQAAKASVDIAITRGPLFHLRAVRLEGQVPAALRPSFKLAPGTPAVAENVLAAGNDFLTVLQEHGYALAKVPPPVAVEVPAEHALDITYTVTSGPRVDIGPISITGLKRTHESYVRRRLELHPGELYQPSKIEAAREDLASTGIFQGVRISAAKKLAPDGTLPLRVDVSERKRFSVSFDVGFSTDLGGSAGVTWTERNLFGNAEQLALTAEVTGLGGSDSTGEGYLAKAVFTKPDWYHRDQTLTLDVEAIRQALESYTQTAEIAGGAVSRKLGKEWTVSGGLTGTQETILQEGVTRDYTLAAVPLTAQFDSTAVKQPFDDPTHGVRVALDLTPTQSFGGSSSTFVILQGNASTYFDFATLGISPPGHSVLAVRGLVGSVQGATDFELPPDQRFYAGGSNTVRGFKYQTVGPLFADGNPIGGTSIDAASLEFRQRVWGNIGAAVFADAGQVGTTSAPFTGTLREGVGVGARYYTAIGPIRVDVAVPVNRPPHGDSFELYLGIGESF